MFRRWRPIYVSVLLVILGAVAILFALAFSPRWYVNWTRFEKIEEGMTPQEVEAVIGLPPGDHTILRQIPTLDATGPEFLYASPDMQSQWWASDTGFILVFYKEGKVIRREFADAHDTPSRDLLDVLGRFAPGHRPEEELTASDRTGK